MSRIFINYDKNDIKTWPADGTYCLINCKFGPPTINTLYGLRYIEHGVPAIARFENLRFITTIGEPKEVISWSVL